MSDNECEGCKNGLEDMRTKQDELMKKYGWIVHYIISDADYPFSVNVHTHGFPSKFKHPDMQLCVPISQENAQGIMWNLAKRLETGDTFQPNEKYNDIIEGFPVLICHAMENSRDILRVVFPDKNGRFDTEFSLTQIKDLK